MSLENFGGEHKRDGMANHEETSGSPLPGAQKQNGEHRARRLGWCIGVSGSVREPQRFALLAPITWQLVTAATQGVKVQVTGLSPFKDGLDDVGCQRGQAQNFRHPTRLELQ